jgi:TonB family protein
MITTNNHIHLSIASSVLLLLGVAFAEDHKVAGERLVQAAQQASDIRVEGAPSFRLEGTFRIIPKAPGKESTGRYTEIWHSQTKWRREVETSSFHHVEIGGGNRRWVVATGTDRPNAAFDRDLTLLPNPINLKITGTSKRHLNNATATCINFETEWSKGTDCLDPQTGVLLLREESITRGDARHSSCSYKNHEKFGDHWFPRSIRCLTNRGDDIELTISKLAAELSVEEGLFTKPQDAIESVNCLGHVVPPRAIYSPDPKYPDHHNESPIVVLWMTVGLDGKAQDPRIARSAGKDFDQPALDMVRQWRFEPSTCDGVSVPVQINIEVNFRKF